MATIISNTLEFVKETWDDPGDYPSAAGSGPLPSCQYYESCNGEVVIQFSADELNEDGTVPFDETISELIGDIEIPAEIHSIKWQWECESLPSPLIGARITCSPNEFESDTIDGYYDDD